MESVKSKSAPTGWLIGGGEMGERIRSYDWSQTRLGRIEQWPQSLKTAVRIMLTSRQPIWIGWGHELTYLYNDPYKSIIGGKHPRMLGQPTAIVWQEIWEDIGPMLATAMGGVEGTYVESQLLVMERHGYREETYYTFSYSPIPDDDGSPGGIICANTDDTRRVIGERQLALLRDLGAGAGEARTWQEAVRRSADALATDRRDIPFSLIYLSDPDGPQFSLAGASGIAPGHPAAPGTLLADQPPWRLGQALHGRDAVVLIDSLTELDFLSLPAGPWEQPPAQAALVPIASSGQTGRGGVLVVGLNPFRPFDDGYGNFLRLVAGQISASIACAQAYEEERKRAEALAEIDRAKTRFFANVSHEFRTPLALMLGPVEDLLDRSYTELSPSTKGQLEIVHRNSLRLLRLVNTLLDFSRIEAGRMRANYEKTDLAAYTAELASNFRSACERAGLALTIDCPPAPPGNAPVYIDRDLWEKIVLNLLSNAFKFTLEGGIEVRLRHEAAAGELRGASPNRAVLTVSDTGVGIPAEELSRVFDRFHRVSDARGRTHEGTGIGLALVRELAKLHGGTVRAESELDKGSTFTVAIPLGKAHLDPLHISESGDLVPTRTPAYAFLEEAMCWLPESANGAGDDGALAALRASLPGAKAGGGRVDSQGRPRILWVDDNADMRDYVARLLSERFAVETAVDGQAALEMARAMQNQGRSPELVLSDVMMPRLDGFGLLRELRADPALASVPIILLSARAGEEARIEGVEAGADDYLIKPFSARELLARVDSQIRIAALRREAERAVRESEQRFRKTADAAPAMLWVTEADGSCSFLSRGWYAFTGQTEEEGRGFGWQKAVHADDREASSRIFLDANRGHQPFTLDYRLRRADGEYRWCIDAGQPRFDDQGAFLGYVGSVFDITERKRAEEALRRHAETFATLVEQSPLGIYTVDSRFRIKHVSVGAMPAFYNVQPLIGRDFAEVMRIIWPEPFASEAIQIFRRTLATGEPYLSPGLTEKRKDTGSIESYEWQVNRVTLADGQWGAVCYFFDTTRLQQAHQAIRESEERFRALTSATSHVVYRMSPDWSEMRHLQGSEFIPDTLEASRTWHDKYIYADDRQLVMEAIQRAIRSKSVLELEHRVMRLDGSLGWMHSRAIPILDERGTVVEWFGAASDVTERKRSEMELEKLNAELEQRVRQRTAELANTIEEREKLQEQLLQAQKMESIGTLASGVAHDFNNLLNIIATQAAVMRLNRNNSPDIHEGAAIIEETVMRGAGIVRQLMSLGVKAERESTLVELNATIEKLANLLIETLPKNIVVTLNLERGLAPIHGNESQIDQILLNLCVNARDAMPEGGRITIETTTVARGEIRRTPPSVQAASFAAIIVKDSGSGMDEPTRQRVFEPFFTTKPFGKGSGLGLAVVYGVVQNHGGFIEVESEPGRGTLFRIFFPIAENRLEQFDDRAAPRAAPIRAGRGETILFVEDERHQLALMQGLLEREGYKVIAASDGLEAVEKFKAHQDRIALAVLDLGLPGLDGWNALQQMRDANPNLKVLIASGFVSVELENALQQAQVGGVVVKPYRLEDVLHKIDAALGD